MAVQATYKRGHIVYATLYNGSGTAISVGNLLEDDGSNGIKALTDGGDFLAIAHENIADAATGVVEIPTGAVYEIDLATGFDPSYLDPIYAAGSGQFDAGGGHAACLAAGFVVDTNPASGSTARALMISVMFDTKAHG